MAMIYLSCSSVINYGLIDFINAKIKIIVLINENPGGKFVLRKHGNP
jgi:hypothetical protein